MELDLHLTIVNLTIYPNPVHNELKIAYSLQKLKNEIRVELYDLFGRKIKEISLDLKEKEGITSFNLSDISSGIYLVNIRIANTNVYIFKLVKD